VAVNVLNNGYSIKNLPCQINKEYVITAYFRVFLPHISPYYRPHILKKKFRVFLTCLTVCTPRWAGFNSCSYKNCTSHKLLGSTYHQNYLYDARMCLFTLCCRRSVRRSDSNLKFQDETDAYTSYKAVGHFTPSPGMLCRCYLCYDAVA